MAHLACSVGVYLWVGASLRGSVGADVASDATLKPAGAESLRRSIVQKNELWFRYWRPTNWAFLYGNRQSQPSSRDHRNGSHRWFPEELRSLLDQINQADATVHGIASKLASQR